jgi:hypothetical protein
MGARTLILAVAACLLFAGPAAAQDPPPAPLFDAAPLQDPGTANPTDGGRSTLLLALALIGVAGAGVLGGLALRPAGPRMPRPPREPLPARPARKVRAARATAIEASAAARRGMPLMVEPSHAPTKEPWRPRVVSDVPPLPAFGAEPPEGA